MKDETLDSLFGEEETPSERRVCLLCGAEIPRGGKKRNAWRRQLYCCLSCGVKANLLKKKVRPRGECETCAALIPPFDMYCSPQCQRAKENAARATTRQETRSQERTCDACGGSFTGRRRKFCSDQCWRQKRDERYEALPDEVRKARNKANYERAKGKDSQVHKKRNNRAFCLEYKGAYCRGCGYKRCAKALHFHHIDPVTKSFELTRCGAASRERLIAELEKCILLCANCHTEVHDGMRTVEVDPFFD